MLTLSNVEVVVEPPKFSSCCVLELLSSSSAGFAFGPYVPGVAQVVALGLLLLVAFVSLQWCAGPAPLATLSTIEACALSSRDSAASQARGRSEKGVE